MSRLGPPNAGFREMLPTPAPFVFGGSFSDFKKEGRKFTRFATLKCLAHASSSVAIPQVSDEEMTRPEDINSLYAAAREQGIGTVDHIDMPEGSLNIVNLVEVARFVEKAWGLSSGNAVDDQDAEAEEWASEDQEDEECQAECDSECSTGASNSMKLDVPRPIVYSGTFQDFKREARKFTRFHTLTRFNKAVSLQALPPHIPACQASFKLLSTIVPDILKDITSQIEATREPHVIIEGSAPQGRVPCQLLALSTPPSMPNAGCVLTTLSDAIVENMVRSTMAGAKRIVRMAAAKGTSEVAHSQSSHREAGEITTAAMPSAPTAGLPSESPKCFLSGEGDSANVDPKDAHIPMKQQWDKISFIHEPNDDGSNWDVGTSSVRGPKAFVGSRRRSLSERNSGSSWGSGACLLEPIHQGKLSLDRAFKVTIPKVPGMRG